VFTDAVLGSTPKNRQIYTTYITSQKKLDRLDKNLEEGIPEEKLAEIRSEVATVPEPAEVDPETKGATGFHVEEVQRVVIDGISYYARFPNNLGHSDDPQNIALGMVTREDMYGRVTPIGGIDGNIFTREEMLDTMATLAPVEQWMDTLRPFFYDYVFRGFCKAACQALWKYKGTESSKVKAYRKTVDRNVFLLTPAYRRVILRPPEGAEPHLFERSLRANTPQGERVTLARSDLLVPGTQFTVVVQVIGGEEKSTGEEKVTDALLDEWLSYGKWHGFGQWRSGGYGKFIYKMKKITRHEEKHAAMAA